MNEQKIRIVIYALDNDDALGCLNLLPENFKIVGRANSLEDMTQKASSDWKEAEVFFWVNQMPNCADFGFPIFNEMTNLKWLHNISTGIDRMLTPNMVMSIKRFPNLIFTNGKGTFSSILAEYVIGACLYFAKDFSRLRSQQSRHEWIRFPMKELSGSVMGLLGCGDIGLSCAKKAKSLGMRVIGCRRSVTKKEGEKEDEIEGLLDKVFGPEELCDLFSQSDYVVLSLPLTASTKNIVDSKVLCASREGQVLINVGRGGVISEEDLLFSLREGGKLRGAALDCFDCEPLDPLSPLWDLENVVISPHNAFLTTESRKRAAQIFVDNSFKFIRNELQTQVSIDDGY